jgi:hypothetical protein
MTTVETLMRRNLDEVFNERDPDRRSAAIAEVYSAAPIFYEQESVVRGRESLHARIEELLKEAPGFMFSAESEPTANHNVGRVTWHFGPPGAPPIVTGTDIAITDDGRIRALYTFIEKPTTGRL